MAKKDIARLTAAEHRELASWARRYGGAWKKMLRTSRESGRLEGPALSAFNKIGPSGLIAYRLTMANPARKAGCQCHANPSKRKTARRPNPDNIDAKTKFTLRREPLNSGGYDRYGEYFGRGAPLFVYEGEVPTSSRDVYGDTHRSQRDVRGHVRAADRKSAMAKIRQTYPMARFFGEKRHGNPARKKSAEKRIWRVVVARDGRSLSLASHVFETVEATTRDGATKAALRRHDHNARVVSVTAID